MPRRARRERLPSLFGSIGVLEARVLGNATNIPIGWSAVDACTNMAIEIKGVTVRHPCRCVFVEGSPDDGRLRPDGL